MNFLQRIAISVVTAFLLWNAAGFSANAQPDLTFTRVINNWPTIELYFKVYCNSTPSYPTSKQFYEVYENGLAVENFTIWCPDPRQRCAISVSLVFDASGSMSGAGNAAAKAGGLKFVELMDGIVDEAAIIWFTSVVNIQLGMTTNKTDIADAVNALPANGATALWDGIYVGVQELILSGSNPCRAVIAMTDGGDNASSHTPAEIIALANRNRIRIYTISLGSSSPPELQAISAATGGKHYQAPTAQDIISIYEEISTIVYSGFTECLITYQAKCMDGGLRDVELKLKDYCSGEASKTLSYRAPRDTTTFETLDIALEDTEGLAGGEVQIPIVLNTPISPKSRFAPALFNVRYDAAKLHFNRISAPAGTLLSGAGFTVMNSNGNVIISTQNEVFVEGSGILAYLVFNAQVQQEDTAIAVLDLDAWNFSAGCFYATLADATVTIIRHQVSFIIVGGSGVICEGQVLQLSVEDGYTDIRWSTGETTRTILVNQPGVYTAQAKDAQGNLTLSDPVTVTVNPAPSPVISPAGPVHICRQGTATLAAPPGYNGYLWSTGEQTPEITISSAGRYTVSVQDTNGCWGASPEVEVLYMGPDPVIQGAVRTCAQAVESYSVNAMQGHSYTWSTTGGTPVTRTDSSGVRVQWPGSGELIVEVYDSTTACTVRDKYIVKVIAVPDPAGIQASPAGVLCPGETAVLSHAVTYDSYLWNTGETMPTITVSAAGDYSCVVSAGVCSAPTAVLHINMLDSLPVFIAGAKAVCQGQTVQYTTTGTPGFDYDWTVENGTLLSGSTLPTISVQWDGAGQGRVRFRTSNARCADSSFIDVTVTPARIPVLSQTGTVHICEGDSLRLDADSGFDHYEWSTGRSGQSLTVYTSGKYAVRGYDAIGCSGVSDSVEVVFDPRPGNTVSVTGDTSFVCEGDTLVLTADEPNCTYLWSNGRTDRAIDVHASGVYSVTLTSPGGCTTVSVPITIDVYPRPQKPIITRNGNLLTCSVIADGYQWFMDGQTLSGATAQNLMIQQDGSYTVRAFNSYGCYSVSDPFATTAIGEYAPALARSFTIAPNPTTGAFEVELEFDAPTAFSMHIVNTLGQTVYSEAVGEERVSFRKSVALDNTPPGVYFFILESGARYDYRKLVVQGN